MYMVYPGLLASYMKFNCGSLLQKLASTWTQLCLDGLKPKAMGCKVLQSTIGAKVTRMTGCGRLYVHHTINALSDKRFGHTRLFSMCTATANES